MWIRRRSPVQFLFASLIFLQGVLRQCACAEPVSSAAHLIDQSGATIKDAYQGHFLIGVAGDVPWGFSEKELNLIKENFNVITPENYLKPAAIHPAEDIWSFERTDALVKWCNENGIAVHGHTLAWHGQTNPWFFDGGDKATITKRLQDHITTSSGPL